MRVGGVREEDQIEMCGGAALPLGDKGLQALTFVSLSQSQLAVHWRPGALVLSPISVHRCLRTSLPRPQIWISICLSGTQRKETDSTLSASVFSFSAKEEQTRSEASFYRFTPSGSGLRETLIPGGLGRHLLRYQSQACVAGHTAGLVFCT